MEVRQLEEDLLPVGTTLVHIAINSGQISSLSDVLESNHSLANQLDSFGRSPLAVALQNGRLAAAELLIRRGANLDVPYSDSTQETVGQVLISNPAFVDLLKSILESSNTTEHIDLSCTLPVLAYEEKIDMLEAVLYRGNVNVDYRDSLQCTALHYSASRGLVQVLRLLLMHGANCQLKTSVGATALHLACSAGHVDIVAGILEQNLDQEDKKVLLHTTNRAGEIPIMCAFTNEHFKVVEYILGSHLECLDLGKRLANSHSLSGYCFYLKYMLSPQLKSPFSSYSIPCLSVEESQWLLHDSVQRNSLEGVVSALSHGANVECLDHMLHTPLILAAKSGSVELCVCLIEHGAKVNAQDVSGKTALMYAFEYGKQEVVGYLLSQATCRCFHPLAVTGPIATPSMLATLVSYFEESRSGRSIASEAWLDWLILAIPIAPSNLFQALVSVLAPDDWVEHILNTTIVASESGAMVHWGGVVSQPTLPTYVQEDLVEDESNKPRPKLVRSFSRPRKWYFTRPPPSFSKEWKFKQIPRPKKHRFKPRQSNCFRDPAVHMAALHNLDVLRFILTSCRDVSLQEKVLLSQDRAGRTVLELALCKFDVISDGCSSLGLLETTGLDEYLSKEFPLPDVVSFEEALLQYLCLGMHCM